MVPLFSEKHIGLMNFKRIFCENRKDKFYLIILTLQRKVQRYFYILIFLFKATMILANTKGELNKF